MNYSEIDSKIEAYESQLPVIEMSPKNDEDVRLRIKCRDKNIEALVEIQQKLQSKYMVDFNETFIRLIRVNKLIEKYKNIK